MPRSLDLRNHWGRSSRPSSGGAHPGRVLAGRSVLPLAAVVDAGAGKPSGSCSADHLERRPPRHRGQHFDRFGECWPRNEPNLTDRRIRVQSTSKPINLVEG
jgi:hypothetical protein